MTTSGTHGVRAPLLMIGVALTLTLSTPLLALERKTGPVTVARSERHQIHSASVRDTFIIQVRLPESYEEGTEAYPVLYVLDGDRSFGLAADTAEWLAWAEEIPEIVVVGIGYGRSREEWWQKRSRDLTPTKDATKLWGEWPLAGGSAAFQQFFASELIPLIEKRYRVTDDRAVAGFSFGGLWAAVTLFSRPELFARYVLIAPALAWDDKRLWTYEETHYERSKTLPRIVFTAVGTSDEPAIIAPWEEFNALIEARDYGGLRWESVTMPGETHVSVFPGALARGLKSVYGARAKAR